MRNRCLTLVFAAIWLPLFASDPKSISEKELLKRTQELFDAVSSGDQGPWTRYFADDCLFFDEKGRSMDKNALVKDITPLPPGYTGTIRVENAHSRIFATTAVLSYDSLESETIFGQKLSARYHQTDTWMYRKGLWQIIASQAFRYYEDPARGSIDPSSLEKYVGRYELAPGIEIRITQENGELYAQRGGRPREQLVPEAPDIFFRKGIEGRRLFHFAGGKVNEMIDRRNNEDLIWRRIPD